MHLKNSDVFVALSNCITQCCGVATPFYYPLDEYFARPTTRFFCARLYAHSSSYAHTATRCLPSPHVQPRFESHPGYSWWLSTQRASNRFTHTIMGHTAELSDAAIRTCCSLFEKEYGVHRERQTTYCADDRAGRPQGSPLHVKTCVFGQKYVTELYSRLQLPL